MLYSSVSSDNTHTSSCSFVAVHSMPERQGVQGRGCYIARDVLQVRLELSNVHLTRSRDDELQEHFLQTRRVPLIGGL